MVEEGLLVLVSLIRRHNQDACELELLHGEVTRASTSDFAHKQANSIQTIRQFAAIDALPYWYRGWTFQEATNKMKFLHYGDLKFRLRDWKILHHVVSQWHRELSDSLHNGKIDAHLLSRSDRGFLARGNALGATLAPFEFAERQRSDKRELSGSVTHSSIPKSAWKFLTRENALGAVLAPSKNAETHRLNKKLGGALTHSSIFYRTSDPKDSIFALRDCFPMFEDVHVDYEKSVENIFAEATVALFRHGGVEAFRYWLHPSCSPHLPSWAVDFTHCNPDLNENGMPSLFPLAIEIYKFDACARSIRCMEFDGSSRLHVAGFVLDEIQAISDPSPPFGSDGKTATDTACAWFRFMQEQALQPGISEKEIYRCIFSWLRTVVYSEAKQHRPKPGDLELLPALGLMNDPTERWGAFMDLFATYIRPNDQHPDVWLWQHEIVTRAQRARLIVTRDKRIGLVHSAATVGDQIAILAAGNLPIILRPVSIGHSGNQMYKIVGGCFVYGMVLKIIESILMTRLLTTSGSMYGESVFEKAKTLRRMQPGTLRSRAKVALLSKLAPFFVSAREHRRNAATSLIFQSDLCLI
ncbi:hypothetical protein Q7P35_005581 [Cladosporium inversicolor]